MGTRRGIGDQGDGAWHRGGRIRLLGVMSAVDVVQVFRRLCRRQKVCALVRAVMRSC